MPELTDEEKEAFLLANGWEKYTQVPTFVKTAWLNESITLGKAPHLCPNWYRHETLNDAYKIAQEERRPCQS